MHAGQRRRTVLLLPVVVVLSLALASGTAWATEATLTGGEGSQWFVSDNNTTSNGQAQNGSCEPGSGANTADAHLGGTHFDAFDVATAVWVNGVQYGGALVATLPNQANFAPQVINGELTVRVNYFVLQDQATMRVLVYLSADQAQGGAITADVEYVNNFGSDGGTTVISSSSGDAVYGLTDRWIVTDDSDGTLGDPANTSVFFGPSNPPETPVLSENSVFNCAGTQGSLDRFQLEVEDNTTETLMFFQQLNPTDADATAEATQYDTTPPPGHPLTVGMLPADFATIVNWQYGVAPPSECSDGVDNDGDGRVDHPADGQCESPSDPSERSQCDDDLDNDADGDIDYPADPGCRSASDSSEGPNPQCSDGVDNDGDGATDYPDDPGCLGVRDNTEGPNPQCSDGVDNDDDGATDHPGDRGCSSPRDNNEANSACADGVDNDGDGRTDYPDDAGCRSATDTTESPDPECGDGVDNDGDGRTDHPDDPGCASARDNSESPDPQCGDGVDNDGDGQTDYPGDPGCRSPRDNSEDSDNPPVAT